MTAAAEVVDMVKATGRKQLVIAGLWTGACAAMPTTMFDPGEGEPRSSAAA